MSFTCLAEANPVKIFSDAFAYSLCWGETHEEYQQYHIPPSSIAVVVLSEIVSASMMIYLYMDLSRIMTFLSHCSEMDTPSSIF